MKKSQTLSDAAFAKWQGIIEERLGLHFPEQRRSFLQTSLSIRMREVGYEDYLEYCDYVLSDEKGFLEWNTLIDHLTVQETRFFRDPAAIKLVNCYIKERIKEKNKSLSLWSVGCATGEEAYSLAMVAHAAIKNSVGEPIHFGITGTDVSSKALKIASKGRYSKRKIDLIDEHYLNHYAQLIPNTTDYEIVESLKARVAFIKLNLLNLEQSPLKNLDVIFCQNVLIYFRKWQRKDIVNELANRLTKGGLLVLGVSELLDWSHPKLQRMPGEQSLAYLKRT